MPLHRKAVYANGRPFCEKIESASGAACAHRMHIQSSLRSTSLLAPTTAVCALCFAFRATFTCYFIELRGAALFVPLLLLFASGVAVVTAPHQHSFRKENQIMVRNPFAHKPLPGF
jgi:hypothetical protein